LWNRLILVNPIPLTPTSCDYNGKSERLKLFWLLFLVSFPLRAHYLLLIPVPRPLWHPPSPAISKSLQLGIVKSLFLLLLATLATVRPNNNMGKANAECA